MTARSFDELIEHAYREMLKAKRDGLRISHWAVSLDVERTLSEGRTVFEMKDLRGGSPAKLFNIPLSRVDGVDQLSLWTGKVKIDRGPTA